MFKAKVPLPSGVEVLRRYDRKEIDGQTNTLRFFRSDATQEDTTDNYTKNPLPGNSNHVLLAVSIGLLGQSIISNDNVDPIEVANQLKDSVFKIETNGGREERILHPTKDYMNFAQTRIAADQSYNTVDESTDQTMIVTLQATGPRYIDNLFYFEPNEAFRTEIDFAEGNFPAQDEFDGGRFGLEVEFYMAKMSDSELKRYDEKLSQAGS